MKIICLLILIVLFNVSFAFGQAGPKQRAHDRPDTTRAKAAGEAQKPAVQEAQETTQEKIVPAEPVATPVASPGRVERALFTTVMEEREPVGSVDSLSTGSDHVYFFTEITGLEGHTVSHRWVYNGETLSEVPFSIGGPRWRIYSRKKLLPSLTGVWKVDIVNDDGSVLMTKRFKYYMEKSAE